MRANTSYQLAAIGVVATLAAIGGHGLLPEKRLVIHPGGDVETSVYSDEMIGGGSRASWVDQHQLHWRCDIKEAGTPRFCGAHIVFLPSGEKGIDLSSYDAIQLKLETHTSDSRVRLFFRNHEAGFSDAGNLESAKLNNVLIPTSDLGAELRVELREFAVAEWWINEWNVPRSLAYPKFDDVRALGIDLGVPPGIGVHELKLHSLEVVGEWIPAERWYRGILFLWLGILTLGSLVHYLQLQRRLAQEHEQLDNLVKSNVELTGESEKLRYLSSHDKLTGALNRHGLERVLAQSRKTSGSGETFGLLVLDLDHFKRINDNRGHDVGDRVLEAVAATVAGAIRQDDHLVRWGGEEFVVLCPRTDQAGAFLLGEKLRMLIAQTQPLVQPPVTLTVSVGVGSFRPTDDFDEAFKRVDDALYKAKRGGRNQVVAAAEENGDSKW